MQKKRAPKMGEMVPKARKIVKNAPKMKKMVKSEIFGDGIFDVHEIWMKFREIPRNFRIISRNFANFHGIS